MSDVRAEPVLAVEEVSLRFGGVQALDGTDLTAEPGVITGLIGPNGAGKTTLFNVITGLERPDRGRVRFAGRIVTSMSTFRRARLGMARTFQKLEPFGSLSARENILAAAEFRKGWARDKSDPEMVTEEILDRIGIRAIAHDRVDAMPTGLARLIELGRALAARPKLLLLDEPGSGLNQQESRLLGGLLLDLVADGMAILLVEHDVELVMRVCARIHVLDFGRAIAVGTPSEIQRNPDVQAAYLGADTSEIEAAHHR